MTAAWSCLFGSVHGRCRSDSGGGRIPRVAHPLRGHTLRDLGADHRHARPLSDGERIRAALFEQFFPLSVPPLPAITRGMVWRCTVMTGQSRFPHESLGMRVVFGPGRMTQLPRRAERLRLRRLLALGPLPGSVPSPSVRPRCSATHAPESSHRHGCMYPSTSS